MGITLIKKGFESLLPKKLINRKHCSALFKHCYFYLKLTNSLNKKTLNEILHLFYIVQILVKMTKNIEETSGIEPETSRSAVECSTTELYLRYIYNI